jgi:hypothetical protein
VVGVSLFFSLAKVECTLSHCLLIHLRSSFSRQTDAVIENQVWKTKVNVQIFQELMSECNNNKNCNTTAEYKTRYIKFIQNSEKSSSSDVEHGEEDETTAAVVGEGEATGGSAEKTDDSAIEQIFLETTV